MPEYDVCPAEAIPPGTVKVISADDEWIAIFNCHGRLFAIEDRCSHDDGPLGDGDLDQDRCVVACPRHAAEFDITTGAALTLPATEPVGTFPVRVDDGVVKITVGES